MEKKNRESNRDGRGTFYYGVRLPTVYGRLAFSVLKPDDRANVYITLAEKRVRRAVKNGEPQEVLIPAGSVLITRWGGREQPIFAIYRDLYQARRGLLYGIAGYSETVVGGEEGEIPLMTAESGRFDDVCALLGSWRRLGEAEREAIKESLAEFIARHEKCRDRSKAAAVEAAEEVRDLTDSSGRRNPLAVASRLRSAQNQVFARLLLARRIHPQEMLRLAVVEEEIATATEIARNLYDKVTTVFLFALKRPAVMLRTAACAATAKRAAAQARRLKMWQAEPFRSDRERLEELFEEAADGFERLEDELAYTRLVEVRRALERILARHELLEAVEQVAILPRDPAGVRRRTEEAKRRIKAFHERFRPLFPPVQAGEDNLATWRRSFRFGAAALKEGNLFEAKEHLRAAAAAIV